MEYNFEIIPNEQTPAVPKTIFSDVKVFIEHYRKELDAFLEFAQTQENAVGLAANQCSLNGERFLLPVFALRNVKTNEWRLIIAPHIDNYMGLQLWKAEGCLTWKNKVVAAIRYQAIDVDYTDMDGVDHFGEFFKGFEAQIWQHEINHLNGVEEDVRDWFEEPAPPKINRNDPCPCGSGKKYKKCCLLLF